MLSVVLSIFLAISCSAAFALSLGPVNEIIFMGPGDQQQREFNIDDTFDITAPLASLGDYAIVNMGQEAADISISVSSQVHLEFGAYMNYMLLGIVYSLDEGVTIISESATTPFSISTTAPINSIFGFAYVAVFISSVSPEWQSAEWPVPFTVNFSITAPEEAEETEE